MKYVVALVMGGETFAAIGPFEDQLSAERYCRDRNNAQGPGSDLRGVVVPFTPPGERYRMAPPF